MDCNIRTHSLGHKIVLNKFCEKALPVCLSQFYGKCYHKFTGKAAVLGLFVFLHRIPQNASVTPRSRSDWRKKYFLPDKPSFSGVIMLNPIVVVVYL